MKRLGLAALLVASVLTQASGAGYDELNDGIFARNHQEWDSAIAHFDKALAANDLIADQQLIAHRDRGDARAAKRDWAAAIDDYTVLLGARPSDEDTRLLRADAYIAAGNFDAAMHDVETMLASSPDDARARALRMHVYEVRGDFQSQLKEAQTFLAKDPNSLEANFEVGIAYILSGQGDDAADAIGKLTDRGYFAQPGGYTYGWLWSAMIDLQKGKPISRGVSMGVDLEKWPGPIIEFFRGRTTEDAVNAAAQQGDEREQVNQACEANFYLGEWRRFRGDGTGARRLFEKAAHDCPVGFVEWFAALAELNHAS